MRSVMVCSKPLGYGCERLMPPVSRFGGGSGSRDQKEAGGDRETESVFEKYFGLVSGEVGEEPDGGVYHCDTSQTPHMVAEETAYD